MIMNVLKDFSCTRRYYLTHPWKFFKECWLNIKAAWMRATKGYCYMDVWNLEYWLCSILPSMFRHMADYGSGYPGWPPFETPEEWSDWLHSMADAFETIADSEYWEEKKNEFYDEWSTLLDYHSDNHPNLTTTCQYDTSPEHYETIRKLYWERMQQIAIEKQEYIKNTLNEMAEHFEKLWD